MARECSTAHADDACRLYLFYNCLAVEFGTVAELNEGRGAVDAFFPFVAFDIHVNSHTTSAACIEDCINLRYLTADTAMYGSTDKTSSLSQQRAHFYLVTLLYDGLCWSTDMLEHTEDCLLRQRCLANRTCCRQLVFCGMNTAYLKCLHILFGFRGFNILYRSILGLWCPLGSSLFRLRLSRREVKAVDGSFRACFFALAAHLALLGINVGKVVLEGNCLELFASFDALAATDT